MYVYIRYKILTLNAILFSVVRIFVVWWRRLVFMVFLYKRNRLALGHGCTFARAGTRLPLSCSKAKGNTNEPTLTAIEYVAMGSLWSIIISESVAQHLAQKFLSLSLSVFVCKLDRVIWDVGYNKWLLKERLITMKLVPFIYYHFVRVLRFHIDSSSFWCGR